MDHNRILWEKTPSKTTPNSHIIISSSLPSKIHKISSPQRIPYGVNTGYQDATGRTLLIHQLCDTLLGNSWEFKHCPATCPNANGSFRQFKDQQTLMRRLLREWHWGGGTLKFPMNVGEVGWWLLLMCGDVLGNGHGNLR